jgi:hypothetical protein
MLRRASAGHDLGELGEASAGRSPRTGMGGVRTVAVPNSDTDRRER